MATFGARLSCPVAQRPRYSETRFSVREQWVGRGQPRDLVRGKTHAKLGQASGPGPKGFPALLTTRRATLSSDDKNSPHRNFPGSASPRHPHFDGRQSFQNPILAYGPRLSIPSPCDVDRAYDCKAQIMRSLGWSEEHMLSYNYRNPPRNIHNTQRRFI